MQSLSHRWDAIYNGLLIADPVLGYIIISSLRVLIGVAALLFLRSLLRYLALALPRPHTPVNAAYWLRWWLWLRLREFGVFKVAVFALALLLLLQIPAGSSGALAGASLYLLLAYAALIGVFVGGSQLFNRLARQIREIGAS